jgi:hypothetical protein
VRCADIGGASISAVRLTSYDGRDAGAARVSFPGDAALGCRCPAVPSPEYVAWALEERKAQSAAWALDDVRSRGRKDRGEAYRGDAVGCTYR